jgi:hypothetical protein
VGDDGKMPSRSPYTPKIKMGKGAPFASKFQEFVESGGVASHKNAVVANIRLNDLRDIRSANGDGTFQVSFFLDTAFWVPWYDRRHFEEPKTTGRFSKYEPQWEFPEVDVEGGMLRWGLRTAEFSKDVKHARRHEVQLGQNYETVVQNKVNVLRAHVLKLSGKAAASNKRVIRVTDPQSHWPRLWRVCINDAELLDMSKMDKK